MKENEQLKAFLIALFIIATLALTQAANAALTLTPMVEGYAGGLFNPASTPSTTANAFNATARFPLNGQTVTLSPTLSPAANASDFAKRSLFANPWLLGAALLAWPSEAGIGSDQVGGWQVQTSSGSTSGTGTASCYVNFGVTGWGNTYNEACTDAINRSASVGQYICPNHSPAYNCYRGPATYNPGGNQYNQILYWVDSFSSVDGHYIDSVQQGVGGYVGGSESSPTPTYRAATLDDFLGLPDPSIAALADLAPQMGVPVEPPFYIGQDVPVGDPYTKPDGSTVQPRAKITPASTPGDVVVDTYDQPLTDAQGNPVSNPTPQDTTEQKPSQCETQPDAVGCHDLGDVPLADPMPGQTKDITFSPVAISANATCPAPYTVTAFGRSIPISYDSACSYASGMHPIVIAVAYITALFIIFGAPRSAQS